MTSFEVNAMPFLVLYWHCNRGLRESNLAQNYRKSKKILVTTLNCLRLGIRLSKFFIWIGEREVLSLGWPRHYRFSNSQVNSISNLYFPSNSLIDPSISTQSNERFPSHNSTCVFVQQRQHITTYKWQGISHIFQKKCFSKFELYVYVIMKFLTRPNQSLFKV